MIIFVEFKTCVCVYLTMIDCLPRKILTPIIALNFMSWSCSL